MLYYANGFIIESKIPLLGWNQTNQYIEGLKKYNLLETDFKSFKGTDNWPTKYLKDDLIQINWNNNIKYEIHLDNNDIFVFKRNELHDIHYTLSLNHIIAIIAQINSLISLHAAAAISPQGKVCLFLGKSGSGKSTLVLQLLNKGWSFISEELSVIDFYNSEPYVYGGTKILRLSQASVKKYNTKLELSLIEKNDKCNYEIKNSTFLDLKYRIDSIYIIEKSNYNDIRRISKPHEVVDELLNNYLYNRSAFDMLNLNTVVLPLLGLISTTDIYRFYCKDYPYVELL